MKKKQSQHVYIKVRDAFTDEEFDKIIQLKRFFEWIEGDPDFADSVTNNSISRDQTERMKRIGILFDINELSLLWESPEVFITYSQTLQSDNPKEKIDAEVIERIETFPLLKLWFKFSTYKQKINLQSRKVVYRVPKNEAFDAWRMRRIASSKSELGLFGYHIDHPLFAFELGDGCNVGCWFCAFATKKLKQNFDYAQNKDYFRDIVSRCVDMFGKDPTARALLYYGTEPHDNPGYLDFIKDYHKITGQPVCTATAVGTDAPWLRELIAYYQKWEQPWPRLSVLSTKMLYEIHDLYTPLELRDVSLLMQMKGQKRCKVAGGRILKEENGLKEKETGDYLDSIIPQGSIACISGFLVNMVHQTIKLVSPCYTTKRWPYGYRVFDTVSFEDASSFQRGIENLIERNMPKVPFPDTIISFRDDLSFRLTENGFDLVSPNQIHHFTGKDNMYQHLGKMIAHDNLTYKELSDNMIDEKKYNPLIISSIVKQLYDGGLLNELFYETRQENSTTT